LLQRAAGCWRYAAAGALPASGCALYRALLGGADGWTLHRSIIFSPS